MLGIVPLRGLQGCKKAKLKSNKTKILLQNVHLRGLWGIKNFICFYLITHSPLALMTTQPKTCFALHLNL